MLYIFVYNLVLSVLIYHNRDKEDSQHLTWQGCSGEKIDFQFFSGYRIGKNWGKEGRGLMVKKILVATDGSEHARRAIELASDMAVQYRAKL